MLLYLLIHIWDMFMYFLISWEKYLYNISVCVSLMVVNRFQYFVICYTLVTTSDNLQVMISCRCYTITSAPQRGCH